MAGNVIGLVCEIYIQVFYTYRFLKNFSGHNSVVNCVATNEDGVLVSCGDNGSMNFWDYSTGYNFQKANVIAQSGTNLFRILNIL